MRPKFCQHDLRHSHDGVVVSNPSGLEIGGAALERLEELDDTIFAALEGDAAALDRLGKLWHEVHSQVDSPFVAESQAVYSRQARRVLDDSLRVPEKALARGFAALEVLDIVDHGSACNSRE